MYKLISKIFDKLEKGLSPRDKTIIVSLMLIISVLGIVLAVRYYNYIQKDPAVLQQLPSHGRSVHGMEALRPPEYRVPGMPPARHDGAERVAGQVRFFNWPEKSPEPHGNETPWKTCTKCHWDEAAQGSLTVNKSTGHARHVFMEKLACKDCHSRTVHSFRPDKDACLRCHKDWKIHGVGMENISCLRCHAFSPKKQEAFIPDRDRCLSCHRKSSKTILPGPGTDGAAELLRVPQTACPH